MGQEVTQVARIVLPDGTPVWARISGASELPAPGVLSYSDTGFTERVEAGVESLTSLVTGVAQSLAEPLRAVRPDEVSVQFGIEFTAKAGKIVGLLADGQAKAGLTVTLTWNGGPPDANAPADPGAPAVPATADASAVPATAEAPAVAPVHVAPAVPAAAAVPAAPLDVSAAPGSPAVPAAPPATSVPPAPLVPAVPPMPAGGPAPAVPSPRAGGGEPGGAPPGAPHAGASPGAPVHGVAEDVSGGGGA